MKPVYLSELNTNTKAYKVKVKVIEKTRPQVSPNKKKISYQNVVLEDEKGNKMRGTLFGDQIDSYEEAFVYNGVYEISNAPVKPVNTQYKTQQDLLDYEMTFGRQTVIQPVGQETASITPAYMSLSQIPKDGGMDDRLDILAVVLCADETPRPITTRSGKETMIRDVIIADHSSSQPIVVTLWSDLAQTEFLSFTSWKNKFKIVGFTALRLYTVKGIALSSTMSTMINEDPKGSKAEALQEWINNNQPTLIAYQAKILSVRNSAEEKEFTTIAELKKKKASNTLQEERFWLKVTVPEPELDFIHAYFGGSKCGKRSEATVSTTTCSSCNQKDCVVGPRMIITCQVADETGLLAVTAYTDNAVKLLATSAADIFHMKHNEDYAAFENVKKRNENTQIMVEMGPHTSLSRNHVLQWVLKNVEVPATTTEENTVDQQKDAPIPAESKDTPNTTDPTKGKDELQSDTEDNND